MDINSQAARYLFETDSNYTANSLAKTLNEVADKIDWSNKSIFDYGEDASIEEFRDYFLSISKDKSDEFVKDIDLLFDVLNAGSDDNVLTDEELEMLTNKMGNNNGFADGFGFYNQIKNADANAIIKEKNILTDAATPTTPTTATKETTPTTSTKSTTPTTPTTSTKATTPTTPTKATTPTKTTTTKKETDYYKDDKRIKTDKNGNKYVTVEPWDNNSKKNNCLERIIKNCYDLDAMGIKMYSKEYYKLEKAVMDANPGIYGDANGNGGHKVHPNFTGRHNKILYDGEKVILPNYKVK